MYQTPWAWLLWKVQKIAKVKDTSVKYRNIVTDRSMCTAECDLYVNWIPSYLTPWVSHISAHNLPPYCYKPYITLIIIKHLYHYRSAFFGRGYRHNESPLWWKQNLKLCTNILIDEFLLIFSQVFWMEQLYGNHLLLSINCVSIDSNTRNTSAFFYEDAWMLPPWVNELRGTQYGV